MYVLVDELEPCLYIIFIIVVISTKTYGDTKFLNTFETQVIQNSYNSLHWVCAAWQQYNIIKHPVANYTYVILSHGCDSSDAPLYVHDCSDQKGTPQYGIVHVTCGNSTVCNDLGVLGDSVVCQPGDGVIITSEITKGQMIGSIFLLPGASKGYKGDLGPQGLQGPEGVQGPQGLQGDPGTNANTLVVGVVGGIIGGILGTFGTVIILVKYYNPRVNFGYIQTSGSVRYGST